VSIYKACDIRGHADQLTPELYRRWGRSLGRQVEPKAKFAVAGDVRATTPEFLAALTDGLCQAGVHVVELGILPTPMAHYARRRLRAAGCAVVTASHNPAGQNGLKWTIGHQPPTPDDVELLRCEADRPKRTRRERGTSRTLDISFDYVAWLQETFVDSLQARRRIVLDPMHGCCAGKARRYLQAVFPHCLFSAIHDVPDPAMAGGAPDCSRQELLRDLCEEVYREKADLGIALDGDGDRLALVDEQGTILSAEEATCVLLHSFGAEAAGQPFVYDLKFSRRLAEVARGLGAEPLAERSGHTFIRRRMLQARALFGAEGSGHYFFRALEGGDDGLFAACWLVAWLDHCAEPLSRLRRRCPKVFATPELRVSAEPDEHPRILQQVRAAWSQYPQSSRDGVCVDFPGGWALVRSSITEPGLTFRFEAGNWPALRDLVWKFCEPLDEVGDRLWMQYTAAMEG